MHLSTKKHRILSHIIGLLSADHANSEGLRTTIETIDAQGNSAKRVNVIFDDGKFHPTTGTPAWDAGSVKTVNDFTIWSLRTKAGKVVQTVIITVSPDGKSHTIATTGVDATGQQINNISVYDKQ